MAIIHFWLGADAGQWSRVAIAVAEVKRGPVRLAATTHTQTDIVLHPEADVSGVLIIPRALPTPDFNPLMTLVTIATEPEFAFAPYTFTCGPEGARITAIPYSEHLRRTSLPDWYVPTQEQMQ